MGFVYTVGADACIRPRKEAPHAVGSWLSLRGLRGFAALPKLSNKNTAAL